MWAQGHASIPPAPSERLRAPHSSPAKGKGLLFLRETEAQAGWVGRKTAHSRSPKGTGTGTRESGVRVLLCPPCHPAAAGSVGHSHMLGHAWAHLGTHASVSTHATCCAHSHTHTRAPPALCPAATHSDKPRTCHLHGHCPLPCPQGATCQPPKHAHSTVPLVPHPMPTTPPNSTPALQAACCAGGALAEGAACRGLCVPLPRPTMSPHTVCGVSKGSESRSKGSTSPAPYPHPES